MTEQQRQTWTALIIVFLVILLLSGSCTPRPQPNPTPNPEPNPEPTPVVKTLDEAVDGITADQMRTRLAYIAGPECAGRYPESDGYNKAAAYIEKLCDDLDVTHERQDVNGCFNIIAHIPGADPVLRDEVVVVGAHLDHLGRTRSGVCLGADDNGSGSVCLMAVTEAFASMEPAPRTISFQWYTREEQGLVGSKYYASHPLFPAGSGDINQHVAMINLDMVGRMRYGGDADELMKEAQLVDINSKVRSLNSKYPFASDITQTGGSRSDHASFRAKGVPTAWAFTGTHNDYHTPRDTVDKIEYGGMAAIAKYVTELAYLCAHDGVQDSPEPVEITDELDHGGERFRDYDR